MIIRAGIDEAGYGPVFGPLTVTCTAVTLKSGMYDQNAFQNMFSSGGNTSAQITDSKKVFTSSKSLKRLEHLALSIVSLCAEKPIGSFSELIHFATGEPAGTVFSNCPWYSGNDFSLPVEKTTAALDPAGLGNTGISDMNIFSSVISVSRFNSMLMQGLNKGGLLFCTVCSLLDRLIGAYPEGNFSIVVDRLGGRKFYAQCLLEQFPLWSIRKIRENSNSSAYALFKDGRTVEIEFRVKADSSELLVSASSLVSKYIRELSMKLFNAFFSGMHPGIRPTQGYPGDADRFLRDISPFMERFDSPSSLVREC